MAHNMAQVAVEWFHKATDRLQTARCPTCSPCPGPISTGYKAAKAARSANFEVYLNSKVTSLLLFHLVLALAFNLINIYAFKREEMKNREEKEIQKNMEEKGVKVTEEIEMARRTFNTMTASLTEGEKAAMHKVQEFDKRVAVVAEKELRKTVTKTTELTERIMISNIFFIFMVIPLAYGPIIDSKVWGINRS